uniref:TauD/TfdA-like domain-containing protein n=1 Tax=Emiliania huxleyi TaxID=2903 RepID=A0A6V2PXB5_EMIHU|mmetsp:Transcript_15558/g.45582  ORF Transcript_15558/g.45582 Transcript_15558/m.45582 type:complete len:235 (-) Transcript_15558:838-1542(-)
MISLLLACSARIALVDPPDSRSSRLPAPDGDLAVRPARRPMLLRGGGADGWEQIGARPVSIDEERVFAGRAFPMTLSPLLSGRTTLTEWAAEHRETLLQLVRENGAVLLRGFGGMETPQGFSDFVMGLRLEEFGMGCSAAPRTEVAPGVFTANEAPPQEKIPFHHEMAQCEDKPAFLFFYCEFPAQTGGATPIIPSNAVATHLREACGHAFSAVRPATSRPPLAVCRPGPSGRG